MLSRLTGMNRLWIAAPLAAAALTLTACSGLASEASTPASEAVAPPASGSVTDSAARNAPAADTQPDRDVIRTAVVSLIVAQPEQSVEELQRIAVASDGYLQSVDSGGGVSPCPGGTVCGSAGKSESSMAVETQPRATSPATGGADVTTVVLRVPSADYDSVMAEVRGLGELAALDVSADDVTGQVTDLDARIAAQRESVARVRQLMKQATNLTEVLQIEQELADRQSQLESLVAQHRQLAQSVSLATITTVLVPQDQAALLVPSDDHWWDAPWDAFVSSWRALMVALAALSPLLLAGAIVAGAVAAVMRRRRRSPDPTSVGDSAQGASPDVHDAVGPHSD